MNPPTANPQAVLAPWDVLRDRGHLNRVEVRAGVSQVGVIPGVSLRAHPTSRLALNRERPGVPAAVATAE